MMARTIGWRRWVAMGAGAAALVLIAAGCGQFATTVAELNPFRPKPKPHVDVLPPAEWERLKQENARRLAGEGIPKQASATQPAATRPVGEVQGALDFFKLLFWDLPKRLVDFYTGNTPGKFARWMEDDKSADLRRTGILRLVSNYDFARVEPYTKRYWQIAQGDPDYLVRVAAIRALNRSRDRNSVAIYVKSLDDPNPLVRLEAAKALANIPDESAVPVLLRHLRPEIEMRAEGSAPGARPERVTEGRDVRVAVADALRNFKTRDVARALVEVLQDRQFEVSYQARQGLVLMTGHDYRYDPDKWREYLAGENPFGGSDK
jgi:HEAT repeats